MMKLTVLLSIVGACAAFNCPDSGELTKSGCFKRNGNIFTTELVNNRDKSRDTFLGESIDWKNFEDSLQKLACECLKRAKAQGYFAFALGFYGECHGAKDRKAYDEWIRKIGSRSNNCINTEYGECKTGNKCVGAAHAEYIYEIPQKAPEKTNGGYSEWSEFTECSKTCGDGFKARERVCNNPAPQNGGSTCEELGETTEQVSCKVKECPINGGFTKWSEFGECSKSCGDGMKKRTRSCTNPEPQFGGDDCQGETEEARSCGNAPCPVNGGYGQWSSYESCSKSCGSGTQSRSRKCDSPAPKNNGLPCSGSATQLKSCNTQACPVNGGYGQWSSYGSCSKSCGSGTQSRSRKCDSPAPENNGLPCSGSATQSKSCNTQACPVNGGYGQWSSYGSCSKSCGSGTQSRSRKCDSPAPKHNGLPCSGSATQSKSCNTQACPVNGGWSSYGSYGSCNKACGSGLKYRTRSCTNPSPQNGGSQCVGTSSQSTSCNTQPCLASTSCYYRYTPFNKEYKGRPVYLDRHSLHCSSGEVMNEIRLQRNSGHTQIRYRYRCCKSQLPCSDSRTTNGLTSNGGGEGDTVYLDRQSINCYNKGMSYLKLDRSGSKWNYKYDCCRVNYSKASVYCYDRSTSFSDDDDGNVVYLDRHNIACPSNYFISYMRLNRNSGHNKIRYNYKCCKINTPAVTN